MFKHENPDTISQKEINYLLSKESIKEYQNVQIPPENKAILEKVMKEFGM